jgi:hypothetical protein
MLKRTVALLLVLVVAVVTSCGDRACQTCEEVEPRNGIPITRTAWTPASPPKGFPGLPPTDSLPRRADLSWYNPYGQWQTTDIWDSEVTPEDDRTDVLVLRYHNDCDLEEEGWVGVMHSLRPSLRNLSGFRYLDIRLRWYRRICSQLIIQVGAISEDVDGDGMLDTEDVNYNGILDPGEDVGLDGLSDSEEECGPCHCHSEDPAGDNWFWSPADPSNYESINGTEGNRADPESHGRPDTEDINGSGFLDCRNDYIEFVIDLDETDSPYLLEEPEEDIDWVTLRLPLAEPDAEVGCPELTNIRYARIIVRKLLPVSECPLTAFQVPIAAMVFVE